MMYRAWAMRTSRRSSPASVIRPCPPLPATSSILIDIGRPSLTIEPATWTVAAPAAASVATTAICAGVLDATPLLDEGDLAAAGERCPRQHSPERRACQEYNPRVHRGADSSQPHARCRPVLGELAILLSRMRASMGEMADYTIGTEVTCSDGVCGEFSRVVLDPVARALTHLVVEPRHRPGMGRLVPIALVATTGEQMYLGCSAAEFDALEDAQETHFLSEASEQLGYGEGEALSWPYYGLGGVGGVGGVGVTGVPAFITTDRVPVGEVDLRRGEHVHASDGDIGRVQGLVIDPADHHVTHVLLEEGHLWGKKELAIPIGAVRDVVADGVRLNLTRDQVRDLPPVDLAHRR